LPGKINQGLRSWAIWNPLRDLSHLPSIPEIVARIEQFRQNHQISALRTDGAESSVNITLHIKKFRISLRETYMQSSIIEY
jgi:hypothetical protein